MASPERKASVARKTKETEIAVSVDLDGKGASEISTGVGFFDHMLDQLARHSLIDMKIEAMGDLHIDDHHTVEDTAIVLGQALGKALGDKRGIRRFGQCSIPMDETLAEAVVDVSGRPYCVHTGEPDVMIGYVVVGHDSAPYGTVLNRHVFETLASHARIALHVRVHYGRDPHHITEAEYKAVARALRAAVEPDPRISGIPSTKGAL